MCTKIYRVYGGKTESESINRGRAYLYHELIYRHVYNEALGTSKFASL